MEKIIKIVEKTDLSKLYNDIERAYYELEQSQFVIKFILSNPDLIEQYDYYCKKMIDTKINYEKIKNTFHNYIIENYSKVISWQCDFYNSTIILSVEE